MTETTPLSRDAFEQDGDKLWVMHCAEGPVPVSSAKAVTAYLERETAPWKVRWQEDFCGLPDATREEAARLIGAEASDITLTATTSTALVTLAQSMSFVAGDEVVAPLGEFPTNAWPWRALEHRGVSVREIELWDGQRAGRNAWSTTPPDASADPEDALLRAIGPHTRLVAVSWVRFQDGLRLDLGRLARGCRMRGVPLVVDGIQGAGTLPIDLDGDRDLEGVVAFASGGHKGLLAPQGLGFLWTRPSFRRDVLPAGSWLSVDDAFDFARPSTDYDDRAWLPDGRRLEQGVPNLIGAAALRESLRFLNANGGVAAIAEHVETVQRRFLEGLATIEAFGGEARRLSDLLDEGRVGSILSLHHEGRGEAALADWLTQGIESGVYASVREGYLRIAFHGWHDSSDVDRVLSWLGAEHVSSR